MNPLDLIHDELIMDDVLLEASWKSYLASLGLAGSVLSAPINVSTNKIPNPNVPAVKSSTTTNQPITLTYENIVAATLVDEAKGEDSAGMDAVMNVILNRTKTRTTKEAAAKCLVPSQFTGWNVVDKKNPAEVLKFVETHSKHPKFKDALELVKKAEAGTLPDNTKGSNHFLNVALTLKQQGRLPKWYDPNKITTKIGKHTFLKL